MAVLQKMLHEYEGEKMEIVHVVNTITKGGEFTVCGLAIPDATLNDEGWQYIDKGFKAPISKCTCVQCKRIIAYFKNLK